MAATAPNAFISPFAAPAPTYTLPPGMPQTVVFGPKHTINKAMKKKKTGVERVWDRTFSRNECNKLMDLGKDELDEDQRRQRKEAKATSKSMLKRSREDKEVIVQGILATDGVGLSQATEYVEGVSINGMKFCSQKAVKRYRNGYESDSE
jgi:hypothetical protein